MMSLLQSVLIQSSHLFVSAPKPLFIYMYAVVSINNIIVVVTNVHITHPPPLPIKLVGQCTSHNPAGIKHLVTDLCRTSSPQQLLDDLEIHVLCGVLHLAKVLFEDVSKQFSTQCWIGFVV